MIDVVFLVLPDTLLLDLAGPAEAFRLANQALRRRGRAPAFRMRHIGPRPQTASSVGLMLGGLEPLPAGFDPAQPTWLVLLGRPGEVDEVVGATPDWLAARDWLGRVVAPRLAPPGTPAGALKLLTVCSGALLAADAGLLAGRQATTHHELLDGLQRLAPAAKRSATSCSLRTPPPTCTGASVADSSWVSRGSWRALASLAPSRSTRWSCTAPWETYSSKRACGLSL